MAICPFLAVPSWDWQRGLRFFVGVVGLPTLYLGLRALFPAEGQPLYMSLRLVRYAAVGIWATFGAPWVFLRLRLARSEPALGGGRGLAGLVGLQ